MRRLAITSGLVATLLGGCQAVSFDQPQDTLSYRHREGDPPSLVFSPSEMVEDPYAWYAQRNDYRPYTAAGVQSGTLETTVTRTVDRQWISGGRVRDHYHTTTYRASITQTVR